MAAEARAGAIEAAEAKAKDAVAWKFFTYHDLDRIANSIHALHDTDTLAAIERIKEQARKEERERCHNAIMSRNIEEHYSEGGRIQFDDLQEFFAATVETAIREDE